jgi:hypothetical protein
VSASIFTLYDQFLIIKQHGQPKHGNSASVPADLGSLLCLNAVTSIVVPTFILRLLYTVASSFMPKHEPEIPMSPIKQLPSQLKHKTTILWTLKT